MTLLELRPFHEVKLQWLRLLLQDNSLSSGAFRLAVYLAFVRYNSTKGKAWPAQSTISDDLDVSKKTIQRRANELAEFWFEVETGRGVGSSNNYRPSTASQRDANELRKLEEREKISRPKSAKGGQSCRVFQSNLSPKNGQLCPPKKEKEKTKEKAIDQKVVDVECSEGKTAQPTLVFLSKPHFGLERWNTFCETVFGSTLERCVPIAEHLGKRGFWLPNTYPPSCHNDWIEHAKWMNRTGVIAMSNVRAET